MGIELLLVLGLILANGLFAGAEIAVLTVRKPLVAERAAAGKPSAVAVQRLRNEPERFLATVQVGITLVSSTAAAVGGARIAGKLVDPFERAGLGRYADDVAFATVILAVTFLSIVIGELVPKSLALRYSDRYAFLIGRPLAGLARLASPVVWFLTACSNAVLRLFGDRTSFTEARVSRDDVKQIVEEAAQVGSVDPRTSEIASHALELPEVAVAELMVPRDRIVAVRTTTTTEEMQRVLVEQGHSRVPVYADSLDHVTGYVIARDVLAQVWQRGRVDLAEIIRPIYAVAATTRINVMLREMQSRHVSIAIVLDERGTTAGLVTIEDLVEELVGEIEDELDAPDDTIRPETDDTALVPGWLPVRKVNRALHIALPITREGVTIAGLCLSLALSIPPVGAKLTAQDGTVLEVIDATARRVRMVRVHVRRHTDENENESDGSRDREREG